MNSLVELAYISCKNLAEAEHIRHYVQESCKYLAFETISYFQDQAFSSKLLPRFRHFLQDLTRSVIFFQITPKIQAFSSKLLPRSDIFFQLTSKIQSFLAGSYKIRHFLPRSSKIPARIMHCLRRPCKWNLTGSCRKCMEVRLGLWRFSEETRPLATEWGFVGRAALEETQGLL